MTSFSSLGDANADKRLVTNGPNRHSARHSPASASAALYDDDAGGGKGGACDSSGSVCHEADAISGILNIVNITEGMGGLPVPSVLSAAAKEFTPGGQGQGASAVPLPRPAIDRLHSVGVEHQAWRSDSDWEGEEGMVTIPLAAATTTQVEDEDEDEIDGGQRQRPEIDQLNQLNQLDQLDQLNQLDQLDQPDHRQDVLYAEVQLEAEVLEVFAESFSDCSLESLQVALAKCDWDLNIASAVVLSALQTASDPFLATRPCRHLLLGGECRRSDCSFSHDFATTPCRYWLQGHCVNSSEACHFLHDLVVPRHLLPDEAGGGVDGTSKTGPGVASEHGGDRGSGGDGEIFGPDQFPSLESTQTRPFQPFQPWVPSNSGARMNTDTEADEADGGARHRLRENSATANTSGGTTFNGTAASTAAAVSSATPSRHVLSSAQETRARIRRKDWHDDDGKDVLLAAVVAATAATTSGGQGQGMGRGRKGGRGRKTRFTAVNLHALLNPSSSLGGEPTTTCGHREPPPATTHDFWASGSRPTYAGSLTKETDATFAEVVGSSPCPRLDRTTGVEAALPEALDWGGRGLRTASVEWVSTGCAVASQYERARKDAAELARARNKLFTSATEAFRRGEGLVARDLARRGRELNVKMREKHFQAANEIFALRNPGDQVFERRTMDLHGLHVTEALQVLDREMKALAERGLYSVRILTGTGHHSKGPTNKARLMPAVENFCRIRGFPFSKRPDRTTGHVGAVDVSFATLSEQAGAVGGGGCADFDEGEGCRKVAAVYYHGR